MESNNESARQVVLSYIAALDRRDYVSAKRYLNSRIRIKGPAGEGFNNPDEFIEMLQKFTGGYDIKKVFVDGEDVCLLYDFATSTANVFICSWYQVREGKITSIQTIFDPRPFGPPTDGRASKV
ncbi:MAG TPA: nuclear transport factor 2 family protein [Nitrososphaerales archaeon]|nr:nuclear transport factor 2 family protein [Nitrososphaerales archaeon]